MSEGALQERGLAALESEGLLGGGAAGGAGAQARGADGRQYVPSELDGLPLHDCPLLCPTDDQALGRSLAILSEHRMTALVCGGGSRLEIGNPPRPIDVVLGTAALSGIRDFEPDDGVVQVWAGTPLSVLREQVRVEGWRLRLDPPGVAATVGGTLAAGAVGPQLLANGLPRDSVLGLDVVLASGQRTRCGGRVVKNVTGYDMAKLYAGSFGTLGVITSAWLRLAPIPQLEQAFVVTLSNFENAFALSLEASRRTTARVSALLSPAAARAIELPSADAGEQWRLLIELAGDEIATRSDAQWLSDRARGGAAESVEGAPLVDRLRAMQGGTLEPGGARVRIAVLPAALPAVAAAVQDSRAALILYSGGEGVGLAYAFSEADPEAYNAAIDAGARAAANQGGQIVLEALVSEAKRDRDVFGAMGPELAVMRRLKQRFDPAGVLNPGRFAGAI